MCRKQTLKEEVFNNAKKLFDIRRKIIKAFEDGIFSLSKENLHKEQAKEEKEEEKEEEIITDWVKVGNYAFKRIREGVSNYVNNGWCCKVGKK